jgi:hypothetical protein
MGNRLAGAVAGGVAAIFAGRAEPDEHWAVPTHWVAEHVDEERTDSGAPPVDLHDGRRSVISSEADRRRRGGRRRGWGWWRR